MDKSSYDFDTEWRTFYEVSNLTPGYFEKRAKGLRMPINYYYVHWNQGFDPYPQIYHSQFRSGPNPIDTFTSGHFDTQDGRQYPVRYTRSQTEQLVANKLDRRVRSGEFNLGVALGEFPETFREVAKAVTTIAKSYRELRRGNIRGAARHLFNTTKDSRLRDVPSGAAGAHLMVEFGVKPILSDIQDSMIYLENLGRRPLIHTVRASESSVLSVDFRRPSEPWGAHPGGSWIQLIKQEGSMDCSGKVEFVVTNPVAFEFQQLGLTNPLTVAWELVPFSFLVDWIVPIGNLIDGTFPPAGIDFAEGYIYTKIRGDYKYDEQSFDLHTGKVNFQGGMRGRQELKERQILTDFPQFRLVLPNWNLSKGQVKTAVALLTKLLIR